jgi:hypothetical protein
MPALFAKMPPKWPLNTLQNIVEDWNYRFGKDAPENHRRDHVVDFCVDAPNLTVAITRACASRAANGKMHNHQSRVKEAGRHVFAVHIIDQLLTRECYGTQVKDFDELHDLLKYIAPNGVGPVTIYDVATRIGAYMKLSPKSLYLHAGVRIGLHALYGKRVFPEERVTIEKLPTSLQSLPPDEIEDLLCAYREYLHPGLLK